MKISVIALFLNIAQSVKVSESPDCPESTQVFSYNERAPAAAGFVQTMTACQANKVPGVECIPNE